MRKIVRTLQRLCRLDVRASHIHVATAAFVTATMGVFMYIAYYYDVTLMPSEDQSAAVASLRPATDRTPSEWQKYPSGTGTYSSYVNDSSCTNDTTYLYASKPTSAQTSGVRQWFDVSLAAIPVGAKILSVELIPCLATAPGTQTQSNLNAALIIYEAGINVYSRSIPITTTSQTPRWISSVVPIGDQATIRTSSNTRLSVGVIVRPDAPNGARLYVYGVRVEYEAPINCGNQVCEAGETSTSCPQDCASEPATCGNLICETQGEHQTCPADCVAFYDSGLPPASPSILEKVRIMNLRNADRGIAYIPYSYPPPSAARAPIAYRKAVKFPLDGAPELNSRGVVHPLDVDGDGDWEFFHSNGARIARVYKRNGQKLWQVEDTGTNFYTTDFVHKGTISVWDITGDGRDEIIHCWRVGGVLSIVIRNGLTGAIIRSVPYPIDGTGNAQCHIDLYLLESGQPIIVAALRPVPAGSCPYQFSGPNVWSRTWALNTNLQTLWQTQTCDAAHKPQQLDTNWNGRAEALIVGKYKLNPQNGTVMCQFPWPSGDHADGVQIGDIDPDVPGFEVLLNGNRGKVRLFSANDCRQLWEFRDMYDPQNTVIGDFYPDVRGLEIFIRDKPTSPTREIVYLDRAGRVLQRLATRTNPSAPGEAPTQNINANTLLGGDQIMGGGSIYDRQGYLTRPTWFWNEQLFSPSELSLHPMVKWTDTGFMMNLYGDARPEFVTWGLRTLVVGSQQ